MLNFILICVFIALDFCGTDSQHGCSPDANCTVTETSYLCLCHDGLTGNGNGANGCLGELKT